MADFNKPVIYANGGLTRWTCLVGHQFEVEAVAGLLCLSWCVAAVFPFFPFFFYERTQPAPGTRPP